MSKPSSLSLTMLQAIELFRAKPPEQWSSDELAAFRARLQESPVLVSSLGGPDAVDRRLAEVTVALAAPPKAIPVQNISPTNLPVRSRSKILWRTGEAAVFMVLLAGIGAGFYFLWGRGESDLAQAGPKKISSEDASTSKTVPVQQVSSEAEPADEEPTPVETTDNTTWRNWKISGPSEAQWTVRNDWDRTNPSNPQPVKLLAVEHGPVTLVRTAQIEADKLFLEINVRPLQAVSQPGHILVRIENDLLADLIIGTGETKWPCYISLEKWAEKEASLQVEFVPGNPGQQIAWWGMDMVETKRQEPKAESLLAQGLESSDPKTRLYSAKKAAQEGDLAALPALMEALHDKNLQIRRAAVAALLKYKDPRARVALRKTLREDSEPTVRIMIATAFANQPQPDDIPALLVALKDPDVRLSKVAARTLAESRQESVTTLLLGLLEDANAETREAAAAALSLRKGNAIEQALLSKLSEGSEVAIRSHAASFFQSNPTKSAIAPLAALLKSKDDVLRRQIVRALSANKDPDATLALVSALEDADAEVRQGAAAALSRRKGTVADAAMLTALSAHSDGAVKKQAVAHFQQFPNPLATGPLVAALGSQDNALRHQVLRALAHSSDEAAIEALGKVIADSNLPLRRAARNALKQSPHPKAATILKKAPTPM